MTKSTRPGLPGSSPGWGLSPQERLEATRLNLPQWIPHQPHDQQWLALIAPRFRPVDPVEIFYGGAAGGGKSDWLLMAALQYVDVPGYSALLLRRTFSELALPGALMRRSKEWLTNTAAGWNERDKTWTFPAGATLAFGFLELDDDVYRYQSAEFQFIGFDELTKFPQAQYTYMFSRLRKPSQGPLSKVPLRQAAASNPGGIGHAWVKGRFVTPAETGTLPDDRIFVPAKLADNPSLERKTYVKSLSHLSETLQQQLLDGDWGAFEGAAYPHFDEALHVLDVELPAGWERFEGMDYGTANPTAWLCFAVDYDGNTVCFDEYYSPGLVSAHAEEILRRRADGWERLLPGGRREPNRVYADPSIRNRTGLADRTGLALSIEHEFVSCGIAIVPANNNRAAGFIRVAELLKPDPERLFPHWHPRYGSKGSPRLFLHRRCANLVGQLSVAPIEDEGIQTGNAVGHKWEREYGHAHAALRYAAMSRPSPSVEQQQDPAGEEALRLAAAKHMLEKLSKPKFVYV